MTTKCPVCPKNRAEVRISLAAFAMTNFLLGMATFMFVLCSSAPEHVLHLQLLLTDYPELMMHLSDHRDLPNGTAD